MSIILTAVMIIGTLTAYALYRNLLGNFRGGEDLDAALGGNRPVNQTGALNILLVGSDSRAGDNKKYGQHMLNDGERTDTIMMLHVSPDRDKVMLVSFPRDSMVNVPQCKNQRTGALSPARFDMINSAFNLNNGGIVCTVKTVETLTQIHIDHYIKVDFTGFKNIVDALDGIQICLPQAVNDRESKLNLPAGRQVVKGEQALAYVRLRHSIGDGSDIGRIKRQQVFMAQVLKKALNTGLLKDPGKLLGVTKAIAQSVEMDKDLASNVEAIIQIAQSAGKLTASGFTGVTVPWQTYKPNPGRVIWKQPDADNFFTGIRNDTQVTATASPSPSVAASRSAPTVTDPAQVKVQVLNGTNTTGKAKEVAEELAALGFKVVTIGDARNADGTDRPKTLIQYKGDGWDQSKLIAAKLQGTVAPGTGKVKAGSVTPFTPSTPVPSPSTAAGQGGPVGPTIQVVVGADWQGVKTVLAAPDTASTVNGSADACKA
ncbi:LCP family protein [Streptosporangiaceae bacterium NEAU-GS5]|nr:LCP family protein [Streptosporangiaceae bacterium NEAU-GS5]